VLYLNGKKKISNLEVNKDVKLSCDDNLLKAILLNLLKQSCFDPKHLKLIWRQILT